MAIALVAAGPASARVVPGHGIAGVTLRMTQAQVHARLGPPLGITQTRGALGFLVTRLHYPRLDVDLQKLATRAVVMSVLTSKPGETTASGVGVGSAIAAIKRLRGARCWTEAGSRYCGIGDRTPLHPSTLFWIGTNAHVTLIEVSLNVNS
ncbi:MAG: hypothetical protein ACRDLM_10830 [Gaiellaceae bacterium]